MWGIPLGLILRAVAVLAVAVALFTFKHHYDEGKREQGRQEVRSELQPIIDAARARAANLTLEYQAADARAREAEARRDVEQKASHERIAALVARVERSARISVPRDVARVLDATADPGKPGDAAAAAEQGEAVAYSAQEFAQFIADAREAYDSAIADDLSCRQRYEDARQAQLKEQQ